MDKAIKYLEKELLKGERANKIHTRNLLSFILWINPCLEDPSGDKVSKFQNDLQIQSDFTLASATSANVWISYEVIYYE